jgi:hypothetical protein
MRSDPSHYAMAHDAPQLGQVWEVNGAVVLIVAYEPNTTIRRKIHHSYLPYEGLILHDDDMMWIPGETLKFSKEELMRDTSGPDHHTLRIT